MRFLKVLTFVFIVFLTFSLYAAYTISDTDRTYLKSRGFTDEQISEHETHIRERDNTKLSEEQQAQVNAEAKKRYAAKEAELGRKLTRSEEYEIRGEITNEVKNWEESELDKKIFEAKNDRLNEEKQKLEDEENSVSGRMTRWVDENADDIKKVAEYVGKTGCLLTGAATGTLAGMATGYGGGAVTGLGTQAACEHLFGLSGGDSGSFVKIRSAFVAINGGCLFCGIFGKLFEAINNFSTAISNNMADTFTKLLGLGLLFFILFKVIKAFLSFSEIDPKQFFADLFMTFVKAIIAILILMDINGTFGGTSSFYTKIVSPLVELSIGFSNEIQKTDTMQVIQATRSGSNLTEVSACKASSSISGDKNTPMGQGVNEAIQCFLITISTSLINYISMGAAFIADCWGAGGFPNFWMFFVGLSIFIPTFVIYLTFPFKLLDGVFQLMFVFALMPLWVILWVLPATRGYTQKAFNMFLRVLITFICLSVVMLMTLKILGVMLDGMSTDNQSKFWEYLFSDRTKDAAELIDWSTGAFFTCIAMSFLALSLINKTETFVGQFADAGGLGIGSGLEGWARKGTQFVADKTVKPLAQAAAKATGTIVGKGIEKTWDGTKTLSKAAAKKSLYGAGYALGATKRGLRNLNAGPKMSAAQAMTPTGMIPPKNSMPEGLGDKLKANPHPSQSETLSDGSTKETKKTSYTDQEGKKKMEYTHETVRDKSNTKLITSVRRERFDKEGNSLGSTTVNTDLKTGKKTLTEKDAKGKEVRTIIKEPDGATTTQNNYVYDVDGKLNSFEKKIEEKIDGKLTVTKHVKVDAKTGTETDILPHP